MPLTFLRVSFKVICAHIYGLWQWYVDVSDFITHFSDLNVCLFLARQPPSGPGPPHSQGFLITHNDPPVGRTPLDEWSALRRDLYLTIYNTHNRQTTMPPVGFEPKISADKRPQTYALDRAATGTGRNLFTYLFTYLLTYLLITYVLTPRSRILLENLTGFQLVEKFLAFYGTRRFITVFTTARHLSLSWASSIQSILHIPQSYNTERLALCRNQSVWNGTGYPFNGRIFIQRMDVQDKRNSLF